MDAKHESSRESTEAKVLRRFQEVAEAERARIAERKRLQDHHDQPVDLDGLTKFAATFKLPTPRPKGLDDDCRSGEDVKGSGQRDVAVGCESRVVGRGK